ncbi:MAG TPA: tetraacyldisaccharide 4'-kinase [Flavobacteriales bacterium]|nr:tetraacyldisaccharide 4'-kinase [Flavobacteriales bacterium]
MLRRVLLYPFALLYTLITDIRNLMYDKGYLSSQSFDIPIINVGNLSVGGTGKTPQIEYLIRLLKDDYKLAVISRGYKRHSKGFVLADQSATHESIGDEPFQIHQKFNDITLAVDENRVRAIRKVLDHFSPDVILLDDAYQHRAVKAGLNVLLTPFYKPFFNDFVLPSGNLRERRQNAKRADLVIVSKSPENIESSQKKALSDQITKYTNAPVFFSSIAYSPFVLNEKEQKALTDLKDYDILLVTGIANPKPLLAHLSKKNLNFESLKFGDHHHFSVADIKGIRHKFDSFKALKKIILTTEKDYVRLKPHIQKGLFYLPIQTKIKDRELFNQKILDYVRNYK